MVGCLCHHSLIPNPVTRLRHGCPKGGLCAFAARNHPVWMYILKSVILLNVWHSMKKRIVCRRLLIAPFVKECVMPSRAQDVALYLSHHFHATWDQFGLFDLHRLLYLAQGWHLASGKGVLFAESIGAHRSAPLTGTVKGLIPQNEMLPYPDLPAEDEDFLDAFCTTYGVADPETVRRQVDRDDGAWRLTQSIAGEGAVILPTLMRASFRLMLLDHAETSRQTQQAQLAAQVASTGAANVIAFRRH